MREQIKEMTPEALKSVYRMLREWSIEAQFEFFSKFPIQKRRVVFANVWGYADNPKWIARALRKLDRSLEIIFVTDTSKKCCLPAGIRLVQTNTPEAVYYLSTAHIWVDCNRKEPYIIKRTGQIYIQTWHGSLPLKRIEKDCAVKLPDKYLINAKRDSAMTDLYLSNSSFCNDIYRNSFFYKGRIEMTGSARLDPLLNPSPARVKRTRTALGAGKEDIKIAVYAPTFREKGSSFTADGDLDYEALIGALEKRFGGSFVLVTRLHPIAAAASKVNYSERVIDGNSFADLYELLEAADILITDYSNTLFEFAMAKKPVFLYAPDAAEYEEKRGFYFKYDKLPYPIASTRWDLLNLIESYRPDDYIPEQQELFDKLGIFEDGKASLRIARKIDKLI